MLLLFFSIFYRSIIPKGLHPVCCEKRSKLLNIKKCENLMKKNTSHNIMFNNLSMKSGKMYIFNKCMKIMHFHKLDNS
jgi:hypothetical protein